MSINEKGGDGIDGLGLNLKRAPSAGTVRNDNDNNMWERSQSDVNLSSHREKFSGEKVNVSDDDRVYWDLSVSDQGDAPRIPMTNTTVVGGYLRTLETIPQHDEFLDSNSSRESVSSDIYFEISKETEKCESFSKSQTHIRNQHSSGISSLDNLPIFSSYEQSGKDEETRKSCSAIPSEVKRRRDHLADSADLTSSSNINQETGIKNEKYQKCHDPLELFPSNYFCDADFDDNREKIPNYQSKLKTLQTELTTLITYFGETGTIEFEWPIDDVIEIKTDVLLKCREMLNQAWLMPNVGRDCATSLCDLIRHQGLLTYLTNCMSHAGEVVVTEDSTLSMKVPPSNEYRRRFVLAASELYSQVLTCDNLDYILGLSSSNSTPKKSDSQESIELRSSCKQVELFQRVVHQSWYVRNDKAINKEFIAILEAMLKHDENTNRLVVKGGGLDSLIYSCRSTDKVTLRRVAIALVNLGLFGDSDVQMIMAHYKVADWLFPLAFNNDDITKYYACLAIVVLSAHKELTQIVHSSGTLELVFSFINSHSPYHFAASEPSHFQGRSPRWLKRLLPLLKSDNVEAVSLASFHFVMEARIKQGQGKIQVFKDIGAIEVLTKSASSIHQSAAQFSRQALKIIGITLPFSLSHPVPIWTVDDVCNWLLHIGFESLVQKFRKLRVDGDLLLTLESTVMQHDLNLENGIVRQRLLREINKLKLTTTYETCDPSGVYDWLKNQVGADYCRYAYAMIKAGIDRMFLVNITDEMLEEDCFIGNSVHRTRILNAVEACKVKFQKESQYSINCPGALIGSKVPMSLSVDKPACRLSYDNFVLSNHTDDCCMFTDDKVLKNIDIFISYRRSNGAQLASLIMVHLKLRGYRVFLDIERLPAGKFNENLLQSIQRSKNFLIVLTANSLDRCASDIDKKDWIHREIVCAMESYCNIIPVTDNFVFPDMSKLPDDMKSIVAYNAVSWVHDYQEACIDKIEAFVKNAEYKCPFSPPPQPTTKFSPSLQRAPTLIDDLLL